MLNGGNSLYGNNNAQQPPRKSLAMIMKPAVRIVLNLLVSLAAVLQASEDSWSQVSTGAKHTCARVASNHCHGAGGACSSRGAIECFGDDKFGQSSPPPGSFAKVSCGRDTTCALRKDGAVACWGNPESGVVTGQPHAYGFDAITVGGAHACGLKKGRLTCWGDNEYGQASPPDADMAFLDVSAGTHHTCGVQRNGYVVCWGHDGEKESSGYPPTQRFVQVSAGNGHSCGLTNQHQLVCWGRNVEGQTSSPSGKGLFFSSVSCGHRHSCAVRDASRSADAVVCWGSNYAGESRARFRGLFVSVAAGAQHSCGLTAAGDVRCWGDNRYGQSLGTVRTGIRGVLG